MDPTSARQVLAAVGSVQTRTRGRMRAFWLPLCLFGGFMAFAGVVGLVSGPDALGAAALSGAAVLTVVTSALFRRRAERIGLDAGGMRYRVTAVLGILGCVVASSVLATEPAEVAPWLAVGGIYQVFAWLERSWQVSAVGLGLAAVALSCWVGAPTAGPGVLTLVEGLLLVGVGLAWQGRRP